MDLTLANQALRASTEIAEAALATDDPDAVLRLVVRSAVELVEADLGLVMARGEDGQLTVEAVHGRLGADGVDRSGGPDSSGGSAGEDLVGLVLSARSTAARVARSGVPVVVDDFTTDPRTAPFVPKPLRRYGPFGAAPFGTVERPLGVLTVYRRRGSPPFTPIASHVLASFATQAGLVVMLAEGSTARQRVAVYQERERIARDLHDVIVQRLYAAGVQLDLLSRKLSRRLARRDAARLADAVDQLDETIAEVRGTVRALRSADPEDAGPPSDLFESVRAETRTAGELLGFPVELALEGDPAAVPVAVADHVRAALREALANVVRHAGASSVSVRVTCRDSRLRLFVWDNGCGIPPGVSRRGLRNLADRAKAVGGRCDVRSSARIGTTVVWEVPVLVGEVV
ncbi:MAG TPA: GAF domain-containing protein [Pseudonocardiaceae bacterium]|jgi:signal transduction histidine kinase|nr:GAF domain-containing protein [Pseudonocardiaceae bacterium]